MSREKNKAPGPRLSPRSLAACGTVQLAHMKFPYSPRRKVAALRSWEEGWGERWRNICNSRGFATARYPAERGRNSMKFCVSLVYQPSAAGCKTARCSTRAQRCTRCTVSATAIIAGKSDFRRYSPPFALRGRYVNRATINFACYI